MKVSVVIPAFNEEKYIENCLQGLMVQIEKPDEIIVVNNNSTDKTVEVVKKYPVTLINETQRGITPARNVGFNAAHYEIIARCDADSIPPPDWIKKIKEDFTNYKIDGLTGNFDYYDLPIRTNQHIFPNLYLKSMKVLLRGNETFVGFNMALKKEAWEKVKNEVCLDDKKVHEDTDLSIHLVKHGYKIMKDKTLIMKTSARRIKRRPHSFFLEYPTRMLKTLASHI
jgi:glycosyltransferase involved in cell wall biosynthesis